MDEHLRQKGMFVVKASDNLGSPSASADDIKWKILTQLVEDYARVHPKEVREIVIDNKVLAKSSKNQYASSDSIRYALRTPPGLVRLIERKFPNFFIDKKNLHRFMDTFKAFRIPETI